METVRPARAGDLPEIVALIREPAEYERVDDWTVWRLDPELWGRSRGL